MSIVRDCSISMLGLFTKRSYLSVVGSLATSKQAHLPLVMVLWVIVVQFALCFGRTYSAQFDGIRIGVGQHGPQFVLKTTVLKCLKHLPCLLMNCIKPYMLDGWVWWWNGFRDINWAVHLLPNYEDSFHSPKDKVISQKSNTDTTTWIVVGKLFGCVAIDIECKNISISADIGGNIVNQIG